ncbi:MAG: outer membrane beta-barrel protein [Alphaproteobacteria bacterium]
MSAARAKRKCLGAAPARRCGLAILVALCAVLALGSPAHAVQHRKAHREFRPYVGLRLGTMFYFNGDSVPGAQIETPAFTATGQRIPTWGLTLGADLSRYWGAEFTFDWAKTEVSALDVGSLGDYWARTFGAQLRMRYPVLSGRLVPYAIGGGGYGTGGFIRGKNFTYPICCRGSSPFAVAGAGIEYFIGPNVAAGIETKYQYLFRPDITLNNQRQQLNVDSLSVTADLRLYFDHLASGADVPANLPPATDSGVARGYIAVRGGKALFTAPDHLESVTLDDWSGPALSAAAGANFNRHLGAEFALEYARAQIHSPTMGKITGYPFWTTLGLVRLREPLWGDRFTPYVVVGGGLGFAQNGDPDMPLSQSGFTSQHNVKPVAAAGVGFDYFVEHNIALNMEVRDTFLFGADVGLNGQPMQLDLSFLSMTGGLRIFFK